MWIEAGASVALHCKIPHFKVLIIMSSIQILRDRKAALEGDIARILKAAEDSKRSLEQQIARHRADEIAEGKAEIEKIMQKYNLTSAEIFGVSAPASAKMNVVLKRSGYLTDIRQFCIGNS